jgi:hypothetical protein
LPPHRTPANGLAPSGLQDSFGRLIDGDHNGQPGGNAVALLSRSGVKISALIHSRANAREFDVLRPGSFREKHPASRLSTASMMHEVRLEMLSQQEVRDLFAYLASSRQVPAAGGKP